MNENELRVLIVADDALARAGLAALLVNQAGCTVVGQLAGETDLPVTLDVYRPDLILWDLGWDPMPALERWTALADTGLPIVALLPDANHATHARFAGASGLLLREVAVESLVTALMAVVQGLVVFDPSLAVVLLASRDQSPEPIIEELTPRELEVLQLLAEGLSNKAIALGLKISEHTVKFHVNAILGKLGAQSRTEAVVRATRLGLILL